jgi:sugar O-acyltransferase (sialic acid O-acetyltransferase NeuD family)
MIPTYIWGAGGHGKVVADILFGNGHEVTAFIDDNLVAQTNYGVPLVAASDIDPKAAMKLIVAIGLNHVRRKVVGDIQTRFDNATFIIAIHRSAIVAPSVQIGVGTVIGAGAIIGPDVVIGQHCVVNTGACVDHDGLLGDFVSVAPGATLGGTVKLDSGVYVGLGANIIHGRQIGANTVVGAGSTLISHLPANVLALGTPCRILRDRKDDEPYM